ncbi:hypothetical protein U1Q18_034583 [Sarracenia purpurea var. burkii]
MASSFLQTTPLLPSSLSFLVINLDSLVTAKLDGNNWVLWRKQLENILKATGLLNHVNGKNPCPRATIIDSDDKEIKNPAYLQWISINVPLEEEIKVVAMTEEESIIQEEEEADSIKAPM